MMSLKEEYLTIIAGGANLNALCEVTANALENPVALTLPTRTIIAHSQNYTEELIEEYSKANIDMTPEEQEENHSLITHRLMTKHSFIGLYPYLRHKRMNCGCFWKGTLIAVLDVPILKKVIIEDCLKLLEEACSVFTPALILNGGIPNRTIDPMESHLLGLLRGDIKPGSYQLFPYKIPFHRIKSWHIIWAEPDDTACFSDLTGQIYTFCSEHEDIWCTSWGDGLVILVSAQKTMLTASLPENIHHASFSVSEKFTNLFDVPSMLQQARFALRLSHFEGSRSRLTFAKNYKIPMFFLSHTQNANHQDYKSFLLEQIKEYDLKHNSEYLKTLKAYLLHNMDITEIASSLNIHRNTVTYRLSRIEELFDIKLSDCRVITELYLSLFTDTFSD